MKRPCRSWTAIVIALASLSVGCTSSPHRPASRLPSTEARWPVMELTLAWSGERFHVPEPAVVPREKLANALKLWDRNPQAFCRVPLDDGRTAVVTTVRDFEDDPVVSMTRVYVYRSNGTLEIEQNNGHGGPNEPGEWTIYEADGRTPHVRVSAGPRGSVKIPVTTSDGRTRTVVRDKAGPRYITEVLYYQGGLPAWRYMAANDAVIYEERFNPDGSTTEVNADRGLRS